MALTESTILKSVTVRQDVSTIEVCWVNQILRDGEVVSETPHRKAYSEDQRTEFEAEVEGAAAYLAAAGWAPV